MNIRSQYISFFHWFSRRRVWGATVLVSLLLYLFAWPAFFHGLILPRAVSHPKGLQVEIYPWPEIQGTPVSRFLFRGERLTLNRPDTSLVAYGLWEVSEPGRYRLKLECDDAGTLTLNGQDLIQLRGISAHNEGEVEVELKKGRYFLVSHLFNGPGRGWLSLSATLKDRSIHLLEERNILLIDFPALLTWAAIVQKVKKGAWYTLLLSLALWIFLTLWQAGSCSIKQASEEEESSKVEKEDRNSFSVRAQLSSGTALFFLILFFFIGLSAHIRTAAVLWRTLPPFPLQWGNDPASSFERQVQEIRPYLPKRGTLGFISYPENPNDLFRLQYTLSPLIVTSSEKTQLVIGLINDPSFFDRRPLQDTHQLIRDFKNGWVLWQRKTP